LARLPVDVLLATAGRPPSAALPNHVTAVPFADGKAACERASLVVHNGGASTGYQALAAGKPVLGIPSNLDQYLASERIDAQGAGLSLRSGALDEDQVEAAARVLLDDASFAAGARHLRAAFAACDASESFRRFVDAAV
jgi:UDP:flavonoid glycosyltransferase YjiC (YdhE family)